MTDGEPTAWPLRAGADAAARAWLRQGAPAGPPPRQAATVCLLRDTVRGTGSDPGPSRPEVLWITRGRTLAVAPGMLAFPGGAVDEADRARRPDGHAPPDRFAVLARAAARELAEETGHVVAPQHLRPLVRWVTPEHEPRRFDTTFLVGELPPGADPEPVPPGEVHEHGWARPGDLLDEVRSSARTALPPTRAVLARLARAVDVLPGGTAADVVALLAREAVLVPVVPRAAWRGGDPSDDAGRGIDLLLPRHAGDVP